MRKVMGLDPSLAGFGIVGKQGNKIIYNHLKTKPPTGIKQEEGFRNDCFYGSTEARISYLVDQVMKMYKAYLPEAVFIEGYAFSARSRSVTPLAELRGVLYNAFWAKQILWVVVPPPTLKKAATGNGRASKEEMVESACRKWRQCPNDDLADAYALAVYGENNFDDLISAN